MPKQYSFSAILKKHPNLDGTYIEFPYDVQTEFGVRGQVKVIAIIDGIEYRGSLVKMRTPCHILGVTKAIREKIGKRPGDVVEVILSQDTAPRVVELPEDFQQLLSTQPAANEYFRKLSYTHQKEYVQWIEEAKKVTTREKRLLKAIQMLLNQQRHP